MDIIHTVERLPRDLVDRFAAFDPATVYEAQGKRGMVDPTIKPAWPGATLCGSIVTVDCPPGDNLMLHKAVTLAQPGDVLVATLHNYTWKGAWGEVLTVAAQARGIAGLAVDGAIRDISAIRALGFPAFSRGLAIGACSKTNPGRVNAPIVFGGVPVNPGDIIVGDDDGLAIVARESAQATLDAALARQTSEERLMAALKAGGTTLELLKLNPILDGLGLKEERRG